MNNPISLLPRLHTQAAHIEKYGQIVMGKAELAEIIAAIEDRDSWRRVCETLQEKLNGADGAWAEASAKVNALHAKIDELMLEYCPDEMTPEQIATWGENQVQAELSPEHVEQWIEEARFCRDKAHNSSVITTLGRCTCANLISVNDLRAFLPTLIASVHQAAVPEGYVVVPIELKLTNEMKAEHMGEYTIEVEELCTADDGDSCMDESCAICVGTGDYTREQTIPWDTCKKIYKAMRKTEIDAIRTKYAIPVNADENKRASQTGDHAD